MDPESALVRFACMSVYRSRRRFALIDSDKMLTHLARGNP
jgi:hypothetical protein